MINLEKQFELAAGELAGELATMHGTLFVLITALSQTELSPVQRALVEEAYVELRRSQQKFLSEYGDQVGGAAPENN
jgi:hypothetical protein